MIKCKEYIIYLFCIVLAIIFIIFSFITFKESSHQQIKEMNDYILQELINESSYNSPGFMYIIDSNSNIDSSKIIRVSVNKLDVFALHFAIRLFISFALFFLTIFIYTCNNQRHIISINQEDSLTGLFNRDTLITKIQNSLICEIRSCTYNALFMIDLDGFKQINDNYGHIEGDIVLKKVAVQLSKICQSKDIVGRLGGDEYMIFIKGFSDRIAVELFAKQISKSIRDISLTNGVKNAVSGSIGIAISPIHGSDFEELYRKSDLALYSAKYNGKNQFCIYSEQLEKQH